jgi:hypothetical protein
MIKQAYSNPSSAVPRSASRDDLSGCDLERFRAARDDRPITLHEDLISAWYSSKTVSS